MLYRLLLLSARIVYFFHFLLLRIEFRRCRFHFLLMVVAMFPPDVSAMFGELFFLERSVSSSGTVWFPCIVVAPDDLPTNELKTVCVNFYSNVRIVEFVIVSGFYPFYFSYIIPVY